MKTHIPFQSKWITTQDFKNLAPLNIYHKELSAEKLTPGPITNYHVHFRKTFAFQDAKEVILRISADDYYKLYLNGEFICQGPASAYVESYQYNQVDITSFLKRGTNLIAVHVYYQGCVNHVWCSGDNRMGLIADLYADGAWICGTDETWTYRRALEYSGETIGYKTQFLENIDFRKKEADWKTLVPSAKANAGDAYLPAMVMQDTDYRFRPEPAECIRVYSIRPKEIVHLDTGKWFLDFGSEIVGQFYMKMQGENGQIVQILCGEETKEDDPHATRHEMRCNCNYFEECILSGGEDEFEFYDYKAFRYVNIVTDRDNVTPDTFRAVVRHRKFEEKCTLVSHIPYVEDIWKLCVNSLKWGVQEGYLDCPSREKGQYLGDFTVTGLAHLYLTGDAEMYRKTLYDFAETTRVCKGLLAVSSGSTMQEIADFSLQYPLQVLHYYRYTKDLETLQELYPVICGILEYFEAYEREDGLLEHVDEKWNLVDWPKNLRDNYALEGGEHDSGKPCHNVLNAHYIGALKELQEIREILGLPIDEKPLRLQNAFLNAFYDKEKKIFYDRPDGKHAALHSLVLPVFYGIAPEESHDTIKALILEKGLSCGTQFSYFVLKALGKMGAYQEELSLLTNESEHSWVNMLKEGATTTFEAWGKDQKCNTSLCHPWSCSPVIALIEDILQADPSEFGKGAHTILRL